MPKILLCSHYEGFRPFDEGQVIVTEDFLVPHRILKARLAALGFHLEHIEDNPQSIEAPFAIFYFDLPVSGYKKILSARALLRYKREKILFYFRLKTDYFTKSVSTPINKPLRILFIWESKAITPEHYRRENHKWFDIILTQDDSLVDNLRYFKLFNPVFLNTVNRAPIDFAKRKFAVMINANKISRVPGELYSERRRIARFFAITAKSELDIFGKMWGKQPCAKGTVADKIQTLSQYKFAICYENFATGLGYITEKIFDCFKARTVPIYLGAPNIADFIPPETFIDRRQFASDQELYKFLKSITPDQFDGYLKAIEQFLEPEKFYNFSVENYCKIVERALIRKS